MQDPTFFYEPDRMQSPLYTADLSEWDWGGVHTNSGVNNKAAYLMTDGDTFNGKTVTGLGIPKVAKIYYEVQANLLTSASDYNDLYGVLQQACTNLTGTSGITADDCKEVKDAVDATEMNLQPLTAPAPEAPVCPASQTANDLFFDDLENPAAGNWMTQGTGWYYPQNTHPYTGIDATYATSGNTNLWGENRGVTSDHSIAKVTGVSIPSGKTTYLRFNHAYGFEDAPNVRIAYDGGVLEYSTNDGSTWNDAGSLITENGYNGTMEAGAGNPLGGREGFVGESNGYISSRVDLTSLQSQSVRWRFRIGEDSISSRLPPWEIGPNFGWFIDDVRVYTCEGGTSDTTPPFVKSHTPTGKRNVSPQTNVTATFSEEMRESSINKATVKLVREDSTTRVGASLSYDVSARKVILDPKRSLKAGATYRAAVTTGVQDVAGNAMASDEAWTLEIRR